MVKICRIRAKGAPEPAGMAGSGALIRCCGVVPLETMEETAQSIYEYGFIFVIHRRIWYNDCVFKIINNI